MCFKSPQYAPTVAAEQGLFIQQTKLKNAVRWLKRKNQITHLRMESCQGR